MDSFSMRKNTALGGREDSCITVCLLLHMQQTSEVFLYQTPREFLDEGGGLVHLAAVFANANHVHGAGTRDDVVLGTTERHEVLLVDVFDDVRIAVQHQTLAVVRAVQIRVQLPNVIRRQRKAFGSVADIAIMLQESGFAEPKRLLFQDVVDPELPNVGRLAVDGVEQHSEHREWIKMTCKTNERN